MVYESQRSMRLPPLCSFCYLLLSGQLALKQGKRSLQLVGFGKVLAVCLAGKDGVVVAQPSLDTLNFGQLLQTLFVEVQLLFVLAAHGARFGQRGGRLVHTGSNVGLLAGQACHQLQQGARRRG